MVKRRSADTRLSEEFCNYTFRGTDVINYLDNGSNRGTVQELAGHEDVRITALYDRRASSVSLDKIKRMRF